MEYIGKCFVIMGYGIKTDLATGRELNLDKTYKNIIKPAAEEARLECFRADEIMHSGTIDVPMYKHLISADVVIADLSTDNSNAFYELGVRHALRPRTTIAIAESELKQPFDVSHTIIRNKYEHLGKDIGYDEAMRFRQELTDAINQILSSDEIDSPVYTYIKDLNPPYINKGLDTSEVVKEESQKDTLGTVIENATDALDRDDFISAKELYQHAHTIDPNNDYIVQKLALSTYKSKYPDHVQSLYEALKVLSQLNLQVTTDPETLGLAGAIYKRLWEEIRKIEDLSRSTFFYEKGFYIKNDYYNGINLSFLLNTRGSIKREKSDQIADFVVANRIRHKVIDICESLYKKESFKDRSDQYWIIATLEEAYFGVGDIVKSKYYGGIASNIAKHNWERKTTEEQLYKLEKLLEQSPL